MVPERPQAGETLVVREVRVGDYQRVGSLTVAAFRGVGGRELSDGYAAELADVEGRAGSAAVLVAELGGVVVGAVAYVGDSTSSMAEMLAPGEAGIRMLAVDPTVQGTGVGGTLVAACLEMARAGGRTRIALLSTEAMVVAHRLYLRAGFRRAPDRDCEPAPGLRLLGFVKELR